MYHLGKVRECALVYCVPSLQNTAAHLQIPCSADSSQNLHCGFSHSDGGLSHEPENSHSLSEFSGLSERSPLVVQTHANPRVTASPSPLLHDLQQSDSTSYVLLNLAKGKENKINQLCCPVLMCDWVSSEWIQWLLDGGEFIWYSFYPFSSCSCLSGITASSESLIFATDGTGEDDDEGLSSGDYGIDGSAPWYLRVQELAHDSLIAATRAQLARDAKASQDARAASVGNGKDCTQPNAGRKQRI